MNIVYGSRCIFHEGKCDIQNYLAISQDGGAVSCFRAAHKKTHLCSKKESRYSRGHIRSFFVLLRFLPSLRG